MDSGVRTERSKSVIPSVWSCLDFWRLPEERVERGLLDWEGELKGVVIELDLRIEFRRRGQGLVLFKY